jgi:hypothetical protein
MDTQSDKGHFYEIIPARLSKKDQNHNWIFAAYWEYAHFRNDKQDYSAFLFRNEDRTVFGLKEYFNVDRVDYRKLGTRISIDYRKLATRIIKDKEFRQSFISSDPDLPKIWKRH